MPSGNTRMSFDPHTERTKAYLGDGLYARYDHVLSTLWLTAENGLEITNAVALEPEVWKACQEYMMIHGGK